MSSICRSNVPSSTKTDCGSKPSAAHLPVSRYYHPEEFAELAEAGRAMGFAHVEAGPLVRSSYHAKTQAAAAGA